MKTESLIIRNLGPLEHVEIPCLGRVNVFIGASGSGKSTVMKVLAMCRWIYKMQCVRAYLKLSGVTNSPFKLRSENILKSNGLASYLRDDSEIYYRNGSYELRLCGNRFSIPRVQVPGDELSLEKIAYISDKRGMLADLSAGYVSIKHGMFYLDETFRNFQAALDCISSTRLDYLGIKMDVRNTQAGRRVFVSPSSGGDGSVYTIPLSSASSGIQNSVGLHFILSYFAEHYNLVQAMNTSIVRFLADTDSLSRFKTDTNIGAFPYKNISLFVEEPELSLFPVNQKGLVDYMIEMMHKAQTPVNMTLATHSPYILTALNVHMLEARASLKSNTSCGCGIQVDEVTAWEVRDGRVRSLIDRELGMIDGTWLDSVSDTFDNRIADLNDIIYG